MGRTSRWIGLAAVIALAGGSFSLTPFEVEWEEGVGLTSLFLMRGTRSPPPEAMVVAVDREAAQALELPDRPSDWPRSLHGRLIELLAQAGARVVVFDLSFAAPSRLPEDDHALAQAIARAGNVVLLDLLERNDTGRSGIVAEQRLTPIPALAVAAASHGPFPLPKPGPVRAFWPTIDGSPGALTLPMLALRVYDGSDPGRAARRRLDVHERVRYLDFYGPARTVATVGYHEVLRAGERDGSGAAWLRRTFEGRAVFVGYSAGQPSGQDRLRDDYLTVFSRADGLNLSGVEIAATAFANALEDRIPRPLTLAGHLGVVALVALVLAGILHALPGRKALLACGAAAAGYVGVAHLCFLADARWLPMVTPLMVQLPTALVARLLWRYADERRQRRRLVAVVDDLLPEVVVDGLLNRMQHLVTGERQVFGVFIMTDIEGFTAISETMPPSVAAKMLNDYFALIFPSIERHGGSVSEIDGDGMLAFWLDTGATANVRRSACRAALEIVRLTTQPDLLPGWPPLPTRVGIHGGLVSLARVGASRHHEYRVVGDAANTASRIEALSKHLGTRLLVSDELRDGFDQLLTRPLGEFLLVGKGTSVRVHELVAGPSEVTTPQQRLCAGFAEALEAFAARRWEDAAARFAVLLEEFPQDGPSRFYLRIALSHAAEPPPRWDGIIRMAAK